jgi:uncharacterized iron-regulated membrane protein
MNFKKWVGRIHLWLGLASGLIVFFLGITGCMLAFEVEIRNAIEHFRFVEPQNQPWLPPSVLRAEAEKHLDGKPLNLIEYARNTDAALGFCYGEGYYKQILLNPYTGKVLKVKDMDSDFFHIVVDGHYNLWLPPEIGRPIVSSATLLFLILMISGLILWWPKNKAAAKQRFAFKWKPTTRWKRKNYDLHNVLGFYATWIAIFLVITGLVMGFQWFAKSVYWATSGGKTLTEHVDPVSDSLLAGKTVANVEDKIWHNLLKIKGVEEKAGIAFALTPSAPLEGFVNHRIGTYYNADVYHYDQYTGIELPTEGVYALPFKEASVADKIARMNYDIHVGAVLGLPGKILAFFGSLIAASLPITGFCIWWGRRKKKNSQVTKVSLAVS